MKFRHVNASGSKGSSSAPSSNPANWSAAAAAAAAADQLAGLDDGADDDPLLPLALTWRNFKATLTASLEAIAFGFRWRR